MGKNLYGANEKEIAIREDEMSELSLLIRQSKLQNKILQKITDILNDPGKDSLSKKTR